MRPALAHSSLNAVVILGVLLSTPNLFAKNTYEPFKFKCVYKTAEESRVEIRSTINPDNDDLSVALKTLPQNQITRLEAESVYVYSKDESVDAQTTNLLKRFSQILSIEDSKLFSITDITLPAGSDTLRIFKFNSNNGTLGIGVQIAGQLQTHFTNCQ